MQKFSDERCFVMVISDIILISLSNSYIIDSVIDNAEIDIKNCITDFYHDEYPFFAAYEGNVYMITPEARNESNYDCEFLDLPEDGSLRIIWLAQNVKRKILEIIRDLTAHTDEPVVFLAHLQGYQQDKICLDFPSFEHEFEEEKLQFNTGYIISKENQRAAL